MPTVAPFATPTAACLVTIHPHWPPLRVGKHSRLERDIGTAHGRPAGPPLGHKVGRLRQTPYRMIPYAPVTTRP